MRRTGAALRPTVSERKFSMHSHFKFLVISLVFLLTLGYVPAQDSSGTLSISGDIQKSAQWSVETLKTQFTGEVQDIKFAAGKDKPANVGTGIPLLAVIQSAAPKSDQVTKHQDLGFFVILEAYDKYRVFFSLPELMPQGGHAQAWIIWAVDGKLLSGKEAPFRLIVTTDQGHDRNIYGLTKITLVDGNKLANRLKD
jgi:DMSO/TMAO reductase YedYZ molybdopterin-dependent catalytic subunit